MENTQKNTENRAIKDKLLSSSKNSRLEIFGRLLTIFCITVIAAVVALILIFVIERGLQTFLQYKVNPFDYLFGTNWNLQAVLPDGKPAIGALPMILASFYVTILSAIIATPFAIGAGIYMTEISPKWGVRILQPVIELLVGIPSVVYGFIGLTVVVPFLAKIFKGPGITGNGILAGTFVLFVMILPTVTSMTVDALRAVPPYYREASLGLGATRWQTTWRVLLRAAAPGILTAVIFGMARAFGEALAVSMVIGNPSTISQIPMSLIKPAATLTSALTTQMGDNMTGLPGAALWTLGLILLLMSLIFNLVMRVIARKGSFK